MSGGSDEPEGPHDEKCPKCGKWYKGQGVAMNLHKSHCTGNSGDENGSDATEGDSPTSTQDHAETDSETSEGASEDTTEETTKENTEGTGTNPLVESPDTDSGKSGSGGSSSSSDVPDDPGPCPQCDGELIDARGHNVLKTKNGRQVDAPDDFYCSECGRGFNWT